MLAVGGVPERDLGYFSNGRCDSAGSAAAILSSLVGVGACGLVLSR